MEDKIPTTPGEEGEDEGDAGLEASTERVRDNVGETKQMFDNAGLEGRGGKHECEFACDY